MRSVYEMSLLAGLSLNKIESISVTSGGYRLFIGTNEGFLYLYEIRSSPDDKSPGECSLVEILRRPSKERRPVTSLKTVEDWFVLVGIMDGCITVYDLTTYRLVCQLQETKGCRSFSYNEQENILCVIQSRKISLYVRQGFTFTLRKELVVPETPRTILLTSMNCIIAGYRRHYEAMDMNLSNAVKILDIDKEHHLVSVE
eukprot:gene2439-4730_t